MAHKKHTASISFAALLATSLTLLLQPPCSAQFYPDATTSYPGVEVFRVSMQNGTVYDNVDRISVWEVNQFNMFFRYYAAPGCLDLYPMLSALWPSTTISIKFTGIGRINVTYGPQASDWLWMNVTPCLELENGTILTDFSSFGINSTTFVPLGLETTATALAMLSSFGQAQVNATNYTQRHRNSPVDPWTYAPSSFHVNESECVVGTNYTWGGIDTLSVTISRNATRIEMLHQNTTSGADRYLKRSSYSTEGQIETVTDATIFGPTDPYGLGMAAINRTIDYSGYVPDYFPAASFSAEGLVFSTGEAISFTFTGRGGNPPLTYTWDFGDGSAPSTDASPTHAYASNGTYVVTLTVVDSDGDSSVFTMQVYVVHENGGPVAIDPALLAAVLMSLLGAAIVASIATYDRAKRRRRGLARVPVPGGREVAIAAAGAQGAWGARALDLVVFSDDVLLKIDELGIPAGAIDDLLFLLSNVPERERMRYLERLGQKEPEFNEDF